MVTRSASPKICTFTAGTVKDTCFTLFLQVDINPSIMKISVVAVLFAIFAKCTIGSVTDKNPFVKAVNEGDLETAVSIFRQSMGAWSERVKYVIQEGAPNFIINFIKQLNLTDEDTLAILCTQRSLDVMKQIIDLVGFPQDRLMGAASRPHCSALLKRWIIFLAKCTGQKM